MELIDVEFAVGKELDYLIKEVDKINTKGMPFGSFLCVENVGGKSILIDGYGSYHVVDKLYPINQYLLDVNGTKVAIDKEVITGHSQLLMANRYVLDKTCNNITKELLMKLNDKRIKDNEAAIKLNIEKQKETYNKNKEMWDKEGKGTLKGVEVDGYKMGDMFTCSEPVNTLFTYEMVNLINDSNNGIPQMLIKLCIDKNFMFKHEQTPNATIEIRDKKIYFEGVKILKNRFDVIYQKWMYRQIKDKTGIQNYSEMPEIMINILDINKVECGTGSYDKEKLPISIKLVDLKKRLFSVEFGNITSTNSWKTIKDIFTTGYYVRSRISFMDLIRLLGKSKKEVIDEYTNMLLLEAI